MLLCNIPREGLLHLMPKEGEIAEIGTFQGDFAQQIFDTVSPSKLHLIDPWSHQDREDYQEDRANLSQEGHNANYAQVVKRFAPAIKEQKVLLHRAFSSMTASAFDDGSLDWVYIDGLHTYEGVRDDLHDYQSKVKSGGFILGHDYTNNVGVASHYGVVEAVNEFVRDTEWEMIALTNELAPTFVLHRNPDSPEAGQLMAALVYNVPGVVEVRDFPERGFQHKTWSFGGGKYRPFISV